MPDDKCIVYISQCTTYCDQQVDKVSDIKCVVSGRCNIL